MTVEELIVRAMQAATLHDRGDALPAEDLADGVKTYNEMMHALEVDGIALGFVDQVAADTVPVEDGRLRCLRFLLAVDLAAENGTTAPEVVTAVANRLKRKWLADNTTPRDVVFPEEVLHFRANNRHGRYNINEDA